MASSKEYLQFILEQLSDLEEIHYRAMMGEYLSFLLEHRPGAEMSDEELEQFAPWSKLAQGTCK